MIHPFVGRAAIALVCIGVLGTQPLAEEPGDGALARELTVQGIKAQQLGNHGAALAYFERAQREIAHPKLNYFRGKSLDAMARYDDALAEFRKIADMAANVKYAAETRAYIRAIEAEREVVQLKARVAALERACPDARAEPVRVAPHSEGAK